MEARDTRSPRGTVLVRGYRLALRRGTATATTETRTTVVLAPNGAPERYRFEKKDPSGTSLTEGTLIEDGRTLRLVTTQNGARVENRLAVPVGATFSLALEHEVRQGLRDGLVVERPVVLEQLGAVVPFTTTVKQQVRSATTVA